MNVEEARCPRHVIAWDCPVRGTCSTSGTIHYEPAEWIKTLKNNHPRATMLGGRLFVLLFWAFMAIAFVMASLPIPPTLPGNPDDKVVHAAAFFTLASLAVVAFPRVKLISVLLLLGLFGSAIEIIQGLPQIGREASWLDWLVDLSAIVFVVLTTWIARSISAARKTGQVSSPQE